MSESLLEIPTAVIALLITMGVIGVVWWAVTRR